MCQSVFVFVCDCVLVLLIYVCAILWDVFACVFQCLCVCAGVNLSCVVVVCWVFCMRVCVYLWCMGCVCECECVCLGEYLCVFV